MKLQVISHPQAAQTALFRKLARRLDMEVQVSQAPGHARHLAAEIEPGQVVVAAGGDGTLHQVINGLLSRGGPPPQVGVIPLGRGNDVARSLGIPFRFHDLTEMCERPRWRELDLGWIAPPENDPRPLPGVYFVSSATAGFSAQASRTAASLPGLIPRRLTYVTAMALELGRWRSPAGVCEADGQIIEMARFFNVNLANLMHYGGGMIAAPGASGSDGRLNMVTMDLSLGQAVRALPENYRGHFERVPGVHHLAFQTVTLKTSRPVPVQSDGELWGATPVVCKAVPRAISFMVPGKRETLTGIRLDRTEIQRLRESRKK